MTSEMPMGPSHLESTQRRAVLRSVCGAALWVCGIGRGWPREPRLKPDASSALIVVDVQNCFVKGGSLAVAHGEDVVPVINRLAPAFQNVILTQDWHAPGHASFASTHPGKKPYDTLQLAYGNQVLWPDHCVQGTADAALDPQLSVPQAQLILRKGFHKDIDSYSAFMEADRRTPTGLQAYLEQRGIKRLFVVGLATDFCVAWTAIDARAAGFSTYVIEDACRGIDLNGSLAAAWKEMQARGVIRIRSTDLDIEAAG
jgi:nicotinamidase/pyrazinamidase